MQTMQKGMVNFGQRIWNIRVPSRKIFSMERDFKKANSMSFLESIMKEIRHKESTNGSNKTTPIYTQAISILLISSTATVRII